MTAYGVALQPFVSGTTDERLRALDEFAERSTSPDVVPIWVRDWTVDPALLAGIRERGVEPVIYLETADPIIPVDALLRLADTGCILRVNQEFDATWGAPWQSWGQDLFLAFWDSLAAIVSFQLFWCPTAKVPSEWHGAAGIVGFDGYAAAKPPAERWKKPIAKCKALAPGAPVWVGETGIKATEPKRAAWLRSLADVEGVDTIVVMNLLAPAPDGSVDDWRFGPGMDRAFAELVGG